MGFIFISLGFVMLFFSFKLRNKERLSPTDLKGLVAGFGFIVIGIIFLYMKYSKNN